MIPATYVYGVDIFSHYHHHSKSDTKLCDENHLCLMLSTLSAVEVKQTRLNNHGSRAKKALHDMLLFLVFLISVVLTGSFV